MTGDLFEACKSNIHSVVCSRLTYDFVRRILARDFLCALQITPTKMRHPVYFDLWNVSSVHIIIISNTLMLYFNPRKAETCNFL